MAVCSDVSEQALGYSLWGNIVSAAETSQAVVNVHLAGAVSAQRLTRLLFFLLDNTRGGRPVLNVFYNDRPARVEVLAGDINKRTATVSINIDSLPTQTQNQLREVTSLTATRYAAGTSTLPLFTSLDDLLLGSPRLNHAEELRALALANATTFTGFRPFQSRILTTEPLADSRQQLARRVVVHLTDNASLLFLTSFEVAVQHLRSLAHNAPNVQCFCNGLEEELRELNRTLLKHAALGALIDGDAVPQTQS